MSVVPTAGTPTIFNQTKLMNTQVLPVLSESTESAESSMSHTSEARRVFDVQIAALGRVRDQIASVFPHVVDIILGSSGKVIVTGLGKSGIIAHKIAATLASTGTSAVFMNAADALHGDLGMVTFGDTVIMVSNSGATTELLRMLPSLRRYEAVLVGILGQIDTPLARECDYVLNADVGREACPMGLAPTSSSTAALVVGDALACALMNARGFSPEQFAVNHPGGSLGRRLLLKARDILPSMSEWPTVSPDATVREAAVMMTQIPMGAVCVIGADGCLAGIMTDGDLRRHLAVSEDLRIPVRQLMNSNPITASPNDSVDQLLRIMETPQRKIYVLPLVDETRHLVGLIRMHDLLGNR
jgi:arabinose-5-phosphate isomerase